MKNFSDEAIKNAMNDADKMYAKLGSLKPTEELTREDIRTLMFIIEHYNSELKSIKFEREKKHR